MKYVMPTLTSALIDICKIRPEDPIDYLVILLHYINNLKLSSKQLYLIIFIIFSLILG